MIIRRVGFVAVAIGGTNLWRDWQATYGRYYKAMVKHTKAAMAAYGPGARLQGMIWVQVGGRLVRLRLVWCSAMCTKSKSNHNVCLVRVAM